METATAENEVALWTQAARAQLVKFTLETDVVFPPQAVTMAFVVARLTLASGAVLTAMKGTTWGTGSDLVAALDRLTAEAEIEVLGKAGVTLTGDPAAAPGLPEPLPVVVPTQAPSLFKPAVPAMPCDVAAETCSDCGQPVRDYFGGSIYMEAAKVVTMTEEKHGRVLCVTCAGKEAAAAMRRVVRS